MAKISGILTDGTGQIINDCTIELYAKKTTINVLTQTQAFTVTSDGKYSMNVSPCEYDVSLIINGFPKKRLGTINVYSNSANGTLNDFLINPKESELTPEFIKQVMDARDDAKKSENNAKKWASTIDTSTLVKKSGDTMTGELYINGQPVLTKRSYGIGVSHVLGDESIDETKNQYSGFLFTQQQSKGEKPFNYSHVMRSAVSDSFADIAIDILSRRAKFRGVLTDKKNAAYTGDYSWTELLTTQNISNYIPVGVPLPWPTNQPPAGWLECNGSTFDKNKFPKLAVVYPTGKLPDLRGVFIRGKDNLRGLDPYRDILSYQDDAIRNIKGGLPTGNFKALLGHSKIEAGDKNGAILTQSAGDDYIASSASSTNPRQLRWMFFDFDASRVVPTANENRPRNVAFNYIVKAE
jgi:Phage Tail Collar Domain./Prophage tail fibre N-terminal.